MTREQRCERLWTRLSVLIKRRVRQVEQKQSTAATEREMVKVRAEIIKIEVRDEKRKAA